MPYNNTNGQTTEAAPLAVEKCHEHDTNRIHSKRAIKVAGAMYDLETAKVEFFA
jgi:hypothetical protein